MEAPSRRLCIGLNDSLQVCGSDAQSIIATEYAGERQVRTSTITDHLTALEATGMITCRPLALHPDDVLEEKLVATPFGRERLSYLPKRPGLSLLLGP